MSEAIPPSGSTARTGRSSLRILVVDDEPGVRASLRVILSRDYVVCEAASGGEALAAVETFYPDLLVSDIDMPGLDGIDTVKALRRMPRLSQLPVVFITGLTIDEQRPRISELGAADLLPKPFSIHELRNLIQKLIDGRMPGFKNHEGC
jgi:CheY-like chemotaxis protein